MLKKLTRANQRPTTLSLDQAQMIVTTNQNWLVSMEALVDTVDELDHLETTLEHLDDVGAINHGVGILVMDRIQALESLTGRIVESQPSLESDSYSAEDFKDSVLPALANVAEMTSKAYTDNFASILTALSNVSLGSIHTAKTSIKRIQVLKDKLKTAGVDTDVTVSLSGKNVGNAFTLDGRPVGELVGALKKDLAKSKILMEVAPSLVLDYAVAFNRIIKSADLADDDSYTDTVLEPLADLVHPTISLSKKLKLDTELLFNTSLVLNKKPSPKARGIEPHYGHLADLATKQLVTQRGGKPSQRADQIKLSKSDLDQLLNCSKAYCDLVIKGWGTYRKMSSAMDQVMKSVKALNYNDSEMTLSNLQSIKQLLTISKHLPQYYRNPLADETDRCIKMALATRVLVARAIKSNKPA